MRNHFPALCVPKDLTSGRMVSGMLSQSTTFLMGRLSFCTTSQQHKCSRTFLKFKKNPKWSQISKNYSSGKLENLERRRQTEQSISVWSLQHVLLAEMASQETLEDPHRRQALQVFNLPAVIFSPRQLHQASQDCPQGARPEWGRQQPGGVWGSEHGATLGDLGGVWEEPQTFGFIRVKSFLFFILFLYF